MEEMHFMTHENFINDFVSQLSWHESCEGCFNGKFMTHEKARPLNWAMKKNPVFFFMRNFMASTEGMKFHFARFTAHEKIFMAFPGDFHGIFTCPCFIVNQPLCSLFLFQIFGWYN